MILHRRRNVFLFLRAAGACLFIQLLGQGCAKDQAMAEKKESFLAYRETSIKGEPAESYLSKRTALLVCGTLVETAERKETSFSLKLGPSKRWANCSAVCLTEDGYYLTAAHCLDLSPWTVIVSNDVDTRFARAREVWRSVSEDVALLHAPVQPYATFTRLSEPVPGDVVLVMGAIKGPSAGSFTGKERSADDPDIALLHHDAMVVGGDSGGPVVAVSGELLGVTGRASYFWVLGFLIKNGTAYQINQAKLDELITADRNR